MFLKDAIDLNDVKISIAGDIKNVPEVTLKKSAKAYESFVKYMAAPRRYMIP